MAEFSLDVTVLRLLKTRKKYERYARLIPEGTVTPETKKLIGRMGDFFDSTAAEQVSFAEFWPYMMSVYQSKWKPKDIEFWSAAIKPIDGDNPVGYDDTVLKNLLATDLGNKALAYIENWQGEGEIDLGESLRTAVEKYEAALDRRIRIADVALDWDEMLAEDEHNMGLQWRMGCIGRHLRALREGDFGIIAMRPDRGKTSLVGSEISFMAPQALELYPEEIRPTLWLNNEGPGRRILSRIRQAALGLSASEMRTLGPEKARKQYTKLMGGHEELIQVVDIHGFTTVDVEELIRKKRPALVVFDMIDNIQFAGASHNNGERTDQLLEAMYSWARSAAVRYGFAGIATSQISEKGEGERYPAQTLLKDSRTGKQGACDFILTGGYDPSMPNTRFIGTTKNKLKREGASPNPECQVYFDLDRSRFKEPEEAE